MPKFPFRSPARLASLLAILGLSATAVGFRPAADRQIALFAGGCFWSMQKAFDGVPGVAEVTAGYAGGTLKNPSYEQVETGRTGYAESVRVVYDPARISYDNLLQIYWHHIDPTTPNQAFCDRGPQYRSIIFYRNPAQREAAEASKAALDRSGRFQVPVVTAIQSDTPFYPAEEYHQQFYKKNPARYEAYRIGCRRDERLKQLWGDLAVAREAAR
jgi:peptide-methionine (S)-S-oxide reductase